ncbi:Arc family DNA-binding protein [Rhizobium sp. KVB221]|uniref:Arc family DNA-binding protein n=1 Tax=Rhizobium setariae TaxID=2801340 RepID=A0A936YR63_9HYPH|nr:Arc family DNA-binding protein [Rhizobium setariae]MBL0375208.1 Arc family DNA-binding protein [Rhizobium setariae]
MAPKQTDPQFKLRMPPSLKEAIEAAVVETGRSMNAEMVHRLEQSFRPSQGLLPETDLRFLVEHIQSLQENIKQRQKWTKTQTTTVKFSILALMKSANLLREGAELILNTPEAPENIINFAMEMHKFSKETLAVASKILGSSADEAPTLVEEFQQEVREFDTHQRSIFDQNAFKDLDLPDDD